MPKLQTTIDQQELTVERQKNLGSLLGRTSEMFQSTVLAEFKARDLSPIKKSHLLLLVNLDLLGIRISHLAERSRLSKQTVGRRVRALTKRGFVVLEPDPTDGRAKLVFLTEKGIERLLTGVGIMRDVTERFAEVVGQRRITQLQSTLRMLLEEFEETDS